MAKSPLPLILGAGAALLILSKRGSGGTENVQNVFILEEEDPEFTAEQEANFAEMYDYAASVISSVPGVTARSMAEQIVDLARGNPRTLFFLFSTTTVGMEVAEGPNLTVIVTKTGDDIGTGTHIFDNVTKDNIGQRIPAGYNFALKDLGEASQNSGYSMGQRGLAGAGPTTANSTGRGTRTLGRSTRTSGWSRRLFQR